MSVPTTVLREFVRKVYRVTAESEQGRDEFLDGLADTALAAWEKGKTLKDSSGNGESISYEIFFGWTPETIINMISRTRDYISNDTLADALSSIKPVRHVSTDFTRISK